MFHLSIGHHHELPIAFFPFFSNFFHFYLIFPIFSHPNTRLFVTKSFSLLVFYKYQICWPKTENDPIDQVFFNSGNFGTHWLERIKLVRIRRFKAVLINLSKSWFHVPCLWLEIWSCRSVRSRQNYEIHAFCSLAHNSQFEFCLGRKFIVDFK